MRFCQYPTRIWNSSLGGTS